MTNDARYTKHRARRSGHQSCSELRQPGPSATQSDETGMHGMHGMQTTKPTVPQTALIWPPTCGNVSE